MIAARMPRELTVEVGSVTMPAWLAVVREANGNGQFDTLLASGPWWAGGTAEEYPGGQDRL